jgi:hypothetical protein
VFAARAQELQCEVRINSERVQVTDRQLLSELERAIADFINTRRWTNDVVRPEERIKCRMVVTLQEAQTGSYKAIVQIQAVRPVFGTGYETPLLNVVDKGWEFDYLPGQPLQFAENSFTSTLSSLLSFYAYMIIGLDHDSFQRLGGSPYYDRALQILTNTAAQASGNPGWTARDDQRSRYWLLTNLQDPQVEPLRVALYQYFRLGLDRFAEKPEEARTAVADALKGIQQVVNIRPGTAIVRAFFEAKSDEIANVFKNDPKREQKAAMFTLLTEIDAPNTQKYQVLAR